MDFDIVKERLANQGLGYYRFENPLEVVKWFGAIQAQEYPGGSWGIGLRLKDSTMGEVEKAIEQRKIIRTWPMRGTLHFVPAEDAKWMLELMALRVIRKYTSYYHKLGLNDEIFEKSSKIITRELKGKQMTRKEIYSVLEKNGVDSKKSKGLFILGYLSQKAVVCLASHRGKQPTFALFDEWIKNSKKLDKGESLMEITKRYFQSHGPATIHDCMWWSGLTATEIKEGLSQLSDIKSIDIEGKKYWFFHNVKKIEMKSYAHFLPAYDEFLIAYKDRTASLRDEDKKKIFSNKNLIFSSALIVDGKAIGMWKPIRKKNIVEIKIHFFTEVTKAEKELINVEVEKFGKFFGMSLKLL